MTVRSHLTNCLSRQPLSKRYHQIDGALKIVMHCQNFVTVRHFVNVDLLSPNQYILCCIITIHIVCIEAIA